MACRSSSQAAVHQAQEWPSDRLSTKMAKERSVKGT